MHRDENQLSHDTPNAPGGPDSLDEVTRLRYRMIGISFYWFAGIVTLQLFFGFIELQFVVPGDGVVPLPMTLLIVVTAVCWLGNLLAKLARLPNSTLASVRCETVFFAAAAGTAAGTYALGMNTHVAIVGVFASAMATIHKSARAGHIKLGICFTIALVALYARNDTQVVPDNSYSMLPWGVTWNMFSAFLLPYAFGAILNQTIFFLVASFSRSHQRQIVALEQLEHRSERDTLTGLFSRASLPTKFKALNQVATDTNSQLAVALIDLDNFKNINTFGGHDAGDKTLTAFSARLSETLPHAHLFRLGGDEFLVVQVLQGDSSEITGRLQQCTSPMKLVYEKDDLEISSSIGLTIAAAPCSYQRAVSQADIALRQAKRQGKGVTVLFKPGHSVPDVSDVQRPFAIVSPLTDHTSKSEIPAREVGAAILSGQIRYAVQPVFDVQTQRISGAECLLRWQLSDGSIVPIHHYLDTFTVLEWQAPYMNQLIQQKEQLFRAIRSVDEINVHFNYAVETLNSQAFTDRIIGALAATPADLRGFVVEICEQGAKPAEQIIADRHLAVLRKAGVKVAIDDFGAGHSNLERLTHLDADILKLDRQFVALSTHSKRGLAILENVLELAESLQITLIAEGVETEEQEALLARIGITEHQGFLRGRPVWPESFIDQLRQRNLGEHIATRSTL